MSTVFTPSSRIRTTRKNRNISNVLNSFYSLNPNIRMRKISYQADQINKLPIKTIPTKQKTKSKSKSKSPTPLTQRIPHITPRSSTNKYIKKRIFSPTASKTTNTSFMTIRVTKNKSPNRQSDLSMSNHTEIHNTNFSCNSNNNVSRSKERKLKIMLPYTSLMTTNNGKHYQQQSVPNFHFEKIKPYTKLPIEIKKEDQDKNRSKTRSPLKNITPIRNRLPSSNIVQQSSKRLASIPNINEKSIMQSFNSNSFVIKKKTVLKSTSTSSRTRKAKPQFKKVIHLSPSENHISNISTLKTIAVNKTKQINKPLLTQQSHSKNSLFTSANLSYKDLLGNAKSTKKTSRNSEFSSKTNISNNDTVSTKSNYFSKTVHSIAKITQTGFAGPNKAKINQDSLFIYSSEGNEYHFIGVCDGHGNQGHLISNYLSNALPYILKKELKERDAVLSSAHNFQIHKIIENSFILANSKLSNDSSLDTNFSGSTCISVLYSTEKIYCANVGDSRSIMGKYSKNHNKWDCFPLSRDHKPNEYDEAKRIMSFNGRIEQFKEEDGTLVGPLRVWLKTESIPGLAMTRSFGDQVASSVGVICEPEIKDFLFKEEDKFILIASDGLWEYITNNECMEVVVRYYQKNKDSESAVRELYKRAFRAWIENDQTIDDITIILIFFN